MERIAKAESLPPWVVGARAALASSLLLLVIETIGRADKIRPNGFLFRAAEAATLLLGAILLQRLHAKKRPGTAPPSKDASSGSHEERQLVGQPCDECGDRIVLESYGKLCDDCGVALHTGACAAQHAHDTHPDSP